MHKVLGVFVCVFAVLSLATEPAKASACATEIQELNRLQDSLKVELDRGVAKAGDRVKLSWQAHVRKRQFPAYLVVSFDQPVQVSGDGFMALAPGARAPFGIAWNQDRTRAIVPLSQDTTERGSLNIKLQLARNVGIEWSVVGHMSYCASQLA
ncbi:MAG: hypothetical protein GY948_22025 [Alphaproteobacteria bacterium]|nr:hypothetical protein [Alphaproteobacteria bacterium]